MKWLYELWDSKIRTLIIVSFIGFLLLLVTKHYSDEIRYQEALQKYYIQDSLVLKLDNGFEMTIYKTDTIKSKKHEEVNYPATTANGSIGQ